MELSDRHMTLLQDKHVCVLREHTKTPPSDGSTSTIYLPLLEFIIAKVKASEKCLTLANQ